MEVSQQIDMQLPYESAVLLLGIFLKGSVNTLKKMPYVSMFIAAQFIIARRNQVDAHQLGKR